MNEEQQCLLLSSASRFSPPKGVKLSYGTAGFRADASLLQSTVYRVGILAALRSLKTRSVIGLMITASHNKVSDNRVKIADSSGGMLSRHWEPFADALANAPSPQHLLLLINEFVEKEGILVDGDWQVEVLLGETRDQVEMLCFKQLNRHEQVGLQTTRHPKNRDGVTSIVGAVATDMGILTTPQLHWMVRARNKGMKASEQDYFEQLSSSFSLMEKVLPNSFGSKDTGIRCVSLDGDADRLVYFTVPPESSGRIDLVDGDKILSLFALFIREQLSFLNEKEDMKNCHQVNLGVVQTAYANGASTNYLKLLRLEVNFTPTGVKYLHEKATEFDIGIYFEANGHGTVLFSESFIESLEARTNEISLGSKGSEGEKAALRLLAVSKLINQAVGDALSGLLLVEVILQHMGWSINKWNELYHDLPSKQLKVKVADRTAVVTTNAETVVVSPPGLQEAINEETAKYPQGRCFVRPSGTEDVVRVYAEASTQEAAETLANCVAKLVDQFFGFNSS
ncbi:Phosphoacetylglucosamine mutase [Glycine max]|nr:Phosphoacetylglucosamine mutase [Glycine max]